MFVSEECINCCAMSTSGGATLSKVEIGGTNMLLIVSNIFTVRSNYVLVGVCVTKQPTGLPACSAGLTETRRRGPSRSGPHASAQSPFRN